MSDKAELLLARIREMGSVLVAFSGGVDSTLLAEAANRAHPGRALAVTIRSPLSTASDREDAAKMAASIGIGHQYLDLDELLDDDVAANGPRRCYFCKRLRLKLLGEYAEREGYSYVLDGANLDDLQDYRPGAEALAECARASRPLLDCGFSKEDVRALSREWGLATWNKPAAACLATRVAPQLRLEYDLLRRIDEAESFLRELLPPASQLRVRSHGELARIEADEAATRVLNNHSSQVVIALRKMGYRYVTLDLGGYEMGTFNPRELERERGLEQ